MKRLLCLAVPVLVLATPSLALGQPAEGIPEVPSMLQWVLSIFGMLVAVLGLYLISRVGKLTKGGAISGNAHYIVLAFTCLGIASALSISVYSFDLNISDAYVAHLESALRIVAMGFFVMYFYNMLARLRGYVEGMKNDGDGTVRLDADEVEAALEDSVER